MITVTDNKRIAKNTLLLYVRMFFILVVRLYTSRIVLQVLGIDDYGLYNVVGGVVTVLTFLNAGMVSATQRYVTFALGQNNQDNLTKNFCTSINIHLMMGLIIILVAETFGLWFVNNNLTIPDERIYAVNWVYQFSIFSTFVTIISSPYNALIIAHEKMNVFASVSIAEVCLKLAIVFIISACSFDKLIIYSLLLFLIQIIIRLLYSTYCHRHFTESHYHFLWDKLLTKEMISFSLLSLWGNLAVVLSEQGINILLNIFFAAAINAAHAIAYQVQTAIIGFSSNFQMAINPQITKKYSRNDISDMHKLMFASSRFSFYLLFIITLPILIEAPLILNIWLVEVPPHTVNFLRLIILTSLLNCMANPMMIAAQANGNIRNYQIVVGGILLTTIPISFVLLKVFHIPELALIANFAVVSVAFVVRLIFMKHLVGLSFRSFLNNVIYKVIIVVSVSSILPVLAYILFPRNTIYACLVCFICIVSVLVSIYRFGLTSSEKSIVSSKINPIREIRNHAVNDLFSIPALFRDHLIVNAWTYFKRGNLIHNNWGDDINVFFIEHLSGKKVIIRNNSLIVNLLPVKNYNFIGSILGIYENKNTVIWGSGFIDDNHYLKTVPSKICSVRGVLTRHKLLQQGIDCPPIYGDPVLLVSRIYKPVIVKKFDIGIIPNQINTDNSIVRGYADSHDNVLLIDMTDYSKWTDIIDGILSCRLILSDSLHGLIVADSYNIPNVWIYLSDKIVGKHFKFLDYFSSVGRTETEPIVINDSKILNHFVETINDYSCHAHIDYSKLIESCPFRIASNIKI